MGALGIPGVINNFNLYNNGTALVGLTGEISLPDFEGMTETLSGPGILGEIEEVIIGQFGSMELEIPFRILDEDAFKLMSPATSLNLTLRASEQFTVKSTGGIDYKGMRVVVRGRQKKLTGGTVKQGGAMDAAVTVEITYIMIELDGKQRIELDKINNVYKVNGVDLLAKIREQCKSWRTSKMEKETMKTEVAVEVLDKDGEVIENEYTVVFNKPYTFEGETYDKIDLSGLDNLTAADMIAANKILDRTGSFTFLPEMSLEYACIIAAKATKLPVEFFKGLHPKEAVKVKNRVTAFFYGAE